MDNPTVKETLFHHITLKGAPREIGRKEAEILERLSPGDAEFLFKGNDFVRPASPGAVRETIKLFEKYSPNVCEEISGFAAHFGRSPEEVVYYSFAAVGGGNCGQLAALPRKTADRKTYVGRSYEWDASDDKRLLTVKADGVYSHMGFSLLLFGRYDGMNEKGLCVTMTNGIPMEMSREEGLRFWAVVRILLDQCRSVEEAVETIKALPMSAYCILMIADRDNEAVLAEIHDSVKTFKRIGAGTAESCVYSTNHYTLPEMRPYVKNRMKQSVDRYNAIKRTLEEENVSRESLRKLLSAKMPEGLTCHYYSEGLGTLWAQLFDVADLKAHICFGAPTANEWHTFGLDTPEGVAEYGAVFPDEAAGPENWARI